MYTAARAFCIDWFEAAYVHSYCRGQNEEYDGSTLPEFELAVPTKSAVGTSRELGKTTYVISSTAAIIG